LFGGICFVAVRKIWVHPVMFACACAGCGSAAERWRSSRAATWVTCLGTSRPTPSRAASPRLSTKMPPALPRYVRTVHTSVADPCHVVTDPAPDPDPFIFGSDKSPYTFPGGVAKIVNKKAARVAEVPCIPMSRIRNIMLRIRIRGSVPLTNGSDSGSCYFRH
jgi:hypothetical protein